MSRRSPTWVCQRVTAGQKCKAVNPNRLHICPTCGKRRPKRERPAHMSALDLPYEHYLAINGAERCGICGTAPTPGRRLDRDHSHTGVGIPRGLLCHGCNRTLSARMESAARGDLIGWVRNALAYLERAEASRRTR